MIILSFRLLVNFLPLQSAILQMETTVALSIVKNLGAIFTEIPGLKSPQGSEFLEVVLRNFDFYLHM